MQFGDRSNQLPEGSVGLYDIGYDQRDATNALKHFLIGQFMKFFFLIFFNQPNTSKYLL